MWSASEAVREREAVLRHDAADSAKSIDSSGRMSSALGVTLLAAEAAAFALAIASGKIPAVVLSVFRALLTL